MNRKVMLILVLSFVSIQIIFAQKGIKRLENNIQPPVCFASDVVERSFIPPPTDFLLKSASENTSDIIVTYSLFPAKAKVAFEYAVTIWEHLIQSDIPIHIEANWRTDDDNILGSAGPSNYYTNFENIPHENRYYPIAVAERITKTEINGTNLPDIVSTFNKDIEWYFGTDGQTPDSLFDFVTVVLHEIAHGLGFTGFFDISNDLGFYEFLEIGQTSAFDLLVNDSQNLLLVDTAFYSVPSKELKGALTSGELYANSPVAVSNSSGVKPRLYAPSRFNDGASIYHLNEATHPNDLMTHAIGKSEAVHDPGDFVTGILDDIGWKTMFLYFDQPRDIEEPKEISFHLSIESDYPLDTNSLFLHYSTDAFENIKDSIPFESTDSLNLFTAQLNPDSEIVRIHYFITAMDTMNRIFTLPNEAPLELYSINVGPDDEPPVIIHNPIPYYFLLEEELILSANVTDNIGLDTVYVEYSINNILQNSFGLKSDSTDTYSGIFNFNNNQLQDGDEISYKIFAIDSSKNGNKSVFPLVDSLTFKIEGVLKPLSQYYNDFNSDTSSFIIYDFDVYTETNFQDPALHSPHPYPAPGIDDVYWNFSTILKHPIVLSENGILSFDEVVLVEPGEQRSEFGDDDFWDYVVIEGSIDKGKTWQSVADGYDSRDDEVWETNYNSNIVDDESQAKGTSEWFVNREIILTGSDNFNSGDTLFLRFRLHSDPYANGWGWTIDNLRVQIPVSSPIPVLSQGNIQVYPNPFNDNINVLIQANKQIEELSIEVFNMFGQKIYISNYKNASGEITQKINLKDKPVGMYFIAIKENGNTIQSKKIIKNQ